jgi:hypothetical protein
MVGKRRTSVLVAGIVIVVASACSGRTATTRATTTATTTNAPHTSRSAASAASTATTVRPRSTTTTAAPTVTPTTTPEFSFDDSVPPPKLVNTGTDYVAILRSLGAYGNWLAAHRPDPARVSTIIVAGTTLHDRFAGDLTRLRDNGKRLIEELGGPSEYTIISTRPTAFSAKSVEDVLAHKTVVASGRVTSVERRTAPTTYLMLVILVRGHWYLASNEVDRPVNVHL